MGWFFSHRAKQRPSWKFLTPKWIRHFHDCTCDYSKMILTFEKKMLIHQVLKYWIVLNNVLIVLELRFLVFGKRAVVRTLTLIDSIYTNSNRTLDKNPFQHHQTVFFKLGQIITLHILNDPFIHRRLSLSNAALTMHSNNKKTNMMR